MDSSNHPSILGRGRASGGVCHGSVRQEEWAGMERVACHRKVTIAYGEEQEYVIRFSAPCHWKFTGFYFAGDFFPPCVCLATYTVCKPVFKLARTHTRMQ